MKYLPLIALVLFSYCSEIKADNYQFAANSLLVIDWLQTRDIADSDEFTEKNKILGKYPASNKVNKYFLTAIVLNNIIGEYLLPPPYRKYFYIGVISTQSVVVTRNYSAGVRFRF